MNWVELIVFAVLFLVGDGHGVPGRALAARQRPRPPRRVGPRRPQVRLVDHLVPRRRRPLHRVHVRRRARAAVRRGRGRASSRCPTRSSSTRWCSCRSCGCGRCRGCTATSRPPTSCAAATAARCWRSWSRSPGWSRPCPTSRCSSSASRPCCARWGSTRAASSATCRCWSRSSSWPSTPTSPACARPR